MKVKLIAYPYPEKRANDGTRLAGTHEGSMTLRLLRRLVGERCRRIQFREPPCSTKEVDQLGECHMASSDGWLIPSTLKAQFVKLSPVDLIVDSRCAMRNLIWFRNPVFESKRQG